MNLVGWVGLQYLDPPSSLCSSDGAERTDDGIAFHARAAVTGKNSHSVSKQNDRGFRIFRNRMTRGSKIRGVI